MEYRGAYLGLSDKLRKQIKAEPVARKRKGLGAVDREPLEVPESGDLQSRYMTMVKSIFPEQEIQKEYKTEADSEVGLEELYVEDEKGEMQRRPQGRSDVVPEKIKSDPEFMKTVKRLAKKYGRPESEFYRLIQGESAFNPRAVSSAGAVGLTQIMPESLAEIGWTPEEVLAMKPAEQLKVHEQYLDRWGYTGKNSLAILNAAPAFANASGSKEVYEQGTTAWEQNPGWRGKDGRITVASINAYYDGK